MQTKYKSFSEALSLPLAAVVAANDNKPRPAKKKRIRNNSTLPALRWLYDNHPDLAEPVAAAVKSLAQTAWTLDAVDGDLEIRPTVGEIVRAATDAETEDWHKPAIEKDHDGHPYIKLGLLKFRGNELVEYGRTKKGRKLEPRDRMTTRDNAIGGERNPNGYVFRLRGGVASPMRAEPYRRPFSGKPILAPMYDPQKSVEANRAALCALGIDGSVAFDELPFPATKCPPAIAEGAEFLGGVVQPGGTSSSGAPLWESPTIPKGEAKRVIEEVAARGTLQSIGAIVGGGAEDGKEALLNAARILIAANDNKKIKKRSA